MYLVIFYEPKTVSGIYLLPLITSYEKVNAGEPARRPQRRRRGRGVSARVKVVYTWRGGSSYLALGGTMAVQFIGWVFGFTWLSPGKPRTGGRRPGSRYEPSSSFPSFPRQLLFFIFFLPSILSFLFFAKISIPPLHSFSWP